MSSPELRCCTPSRRNRAVTSCGQLDLHRDARNMKKIKQQASEQSKIELELGVAMAGVASVAACPRRPDTVAVEPSTPKASTRHQ
jgi:hypothetical protein